MSEVVTNLPEDEYHEIDAIGSTLARALNKSIDHYEHKKTEQFEPTKSMKLGSWIHQAVLEPERFDDLLDSVPPNRPGSKSWKNKHLETAALFAEYAEDFQSLPSDWVEHVQHNRLKEVWKKVADNKTEVGKTWTKCLEYGCEEGFDQLVWHYQNGASYPPEVEAPTGDKLETVQSARDAVLKHPLVQGGLLDGDTELSFFWQESPQDEPIDCKGRADFTVEIAGDTYLGDLKAVGRSSVTPGSFARVVGRRDYHIQAGMYSRGYEIARGEDISGFIYLAVDTSAPHPVKAMTLDSEALQAGEEHFLSALTTLSEYRKGNIEYTGLDPAITEISLKQWEL
jgi:hypothetical protein